MKSLKLVVVVVGAFACAEAFQPHTDVVARAGNAELTVTRLAEIVASAPELPVDRAVLELLAYRWAEMMAFAERAAMGDSLLDSLTVVRAMWPDTRGAAVDSFHTMVVASQVQVEPTQVDSAFRSGDQIIVGHILKAVNDSMTTEERTAQRDVAVRLHRRLTDGSMDWINANEQNDDESARAQLGIIGVLIRGVVNPRFENAAFALRGGELSDVVETPAGYHIVYRPALEDIRDQFTQAVRTIFVQRQDSLYEEHLIESYDVSFRSNATESIREGVQAPFRFRGSDRTLATFDGGELTLGQFIRWLQVLPPDLVQGIGSATDDEILGLGRSLVSRELIWLQADSAGIGYTPEQYEQIVASFRDQLDQVRLVSQLYPDSLMQFDPDPEVRSNLAGVLVDRYLEQGVQDPRLFVPVPPFLAEQLLESIEWEINPTGVIRATSEAAALRQARPAVLPGGGN